MASNLDSNTSRFYGPYVRGIYPDNPPARTDEILFVNKEAKVTTYLDAYEGDEKRSAAIRVIEDGVKNRAFATKAYTQLDFTEAVSYLLLELINQEKRNG